MPTYEYKCTQCGAIREVNMAVEHRDGHVWHCGHIMERLLSAPSFQLKGDGWYVTDFKGKKGSDADNDDG